MAGNLKGRIAKLEHGRQSQVTNRSTMRFWDALSGAQLTPPLSPNEVPAAALEVLERYQRDGPPRCDVIEQRIKNALERSTGEHNEHQEKQPV